MYQDASNALKTWKATYPMPEGDLNDNYLHGVLGDSKTHIEDGFRELEEFVTSKFLKVSKSKKDAFEHALAALEAMAGGKADGGSWKEKLDSNSTWEDIQREASYHLVQKDGTRLHDTLDKLYKDMHIKKEAYMQVFRDLADSRVASHGGGSRLRRNCSIGLPLQA
jgi:hypothetical protein